MYAKLFVTTILGEGGSYSNTVDLLQNFTGAHCVPNACLTLLSRLQCILGNVSNLFFYALCTCYSPGMLMDQGRLKLALHIPNYNPLLAIY